MRVSDATEYDLWVAGWRVSTGEITLSGWRVGCFTYMAKGFLRFGIKSSKMKLPSSTRKASRTPLACRSAEIVRAPFVPDTCRTPKHKANALLSQKQTNRDSGCRLPQLAPPEPSFLVFFGGAGPEIILSHRIIQCLSPSGSC